MTRRATLLATTALSSSPCTGLLSAYRGPLPPPPDIFGFHSRFVQTDPNTTIHLVERNSPSTAGMPLVLLHGWGDSWRSFARVLPLLSQDRHIVVLDRRGFGNSTSRGPLNRLEPFLHDILQVLDALSLERVVLAAHSTGAHYAILFAGLHPERIAHLVCMSTDATLQDTIIPQLFIEFPSTDEQLTYDFMREYQLGIYNRCSRQEIVLEHLLTPRRRNSQVDLYPLTQVSHAGLVLPQPDVRDHADVGRGPEGRSGDLGADLG